MLVVAAEQMTRALDWSDRATCVLFGDGAGAAVIEAGGENPLAVELSTSPDVETLRSGSAEPVPSIVKPITNLL